MFVFDSEERRSLAGDSQLSIYAALTAAQVIGLIDACGNYLARRPHLEPDEQWQESLRSTPEIAAAHRTLVECCERTYLRPDESRPLDHDAFVFTPAEQADLRRHKYVRDCERITHRQLLDLLRAVRRYGAVAVPAALERDSTIPSRRFNRVFKRYLHAHNWVIRFGREPFTDSEFLEDLHRTVLSQT